MADQSTVPSKDQYRFKDGRFMPGHIAKHRRDPAKVLEALLSLDLGTLTIASEVYWRDRLAYVRLTCSACGIEKESVTNNLFSGGVKNCRCQTKYKVPEPRIKYTDARQKALSSRYSLLSQRCNNPRATGYHNYGGRGIENRFKSVEEFITWMLENLPHQTYKGVEIDRVDNNGHYEPGNLRLVPHIVNANNKRNRRSVIYQGVSVSFSHLWHLLKTDYPEFPLAASTVDRLAREGMSPEEILKHRRQRPGGRPHNKNTYPDSNIVSLYRSTGNSKPFLFSQGFNHD